MNFAQPISRRPAQQNSLVWREANLQLAKQLRCAGIACGMELGARSMKAQMRAANKSGAKWVVIRGDNELAAGTAALKNLADGAQQDVPLAELAARLKG